MLTQEQAVEIKVFARRGVAIREIARQLGCSRNTVKRYLKDAKAARYRPRMPRPTKLDPFKAYVLERIDARGRIGFPQRYFIASCVSAAMPAV